MKLAYAKDDGVAIVTAVPREVLEPLIGEPNALGVRTLSHDDYVAHVLERNGLAAEEVVRLPDNWQPPAAPRASWVLTEMGEIGVDAQKASAIYRQSYGAVIDRHINATAQAKGYDSAVSLVSYRFDEVQSVWAAEAEAFFSWRKPGVGIRHRPAGLGARRRAPPSRASTSCSPSCRRSRGRPSATGRCGLTRLWRQRDVACAAVSA